MRDRIRVNDAVYAPSIYQNEPSVRWLCRVVASDGDRVVVDPVHDEAFPFEVASERCVPAGRYVRERFLGILPFWSLKQDEKPAFIGEV